MKTMKKVFSMLIAVCMMVVLCVPAMAADTTYTITVTNSNDGHTYGAYQVFDGDLSSDGVLSNITWGSGVNGTEILSALNGTTNPAPYADAKAVAAALAAKTLSAADFAQVVGANLGTVTATSTQKQDKTGYTISITNPGYYFVKDQNTVTGDDTATGYILEVVKDVTVNPKGTKPTVEKKVADINDSTENQQSAWKDSADYDINDNIPYQLTGTLPSNYADYTTYYYEFTDTLSKGLTYNSKAKVYVVNGETETDVTSGFTVTSSNVTSGDYAGGTALSIKCENLKNLKDSSGNTLVSATSKIVVEYSAKLNENAVVGSAGNPNKVALTYSNNPNKDKGGEHGTTPEDKNIVFTYKVIVNKVDKDNAALAGAGFTLYKYDVDSAAEKEADKWVAVGTATATGDGSNVFTWSGLDDGKYKFVETTTPAGYNTMDDQYFTVTATHTDGDNPQLTELSGTKETGSIITFTADKDAGSLTSNVINYKGSELPSTGGIGTTVFYVVGGVMVAGAAILLITKKRMSRDAE